MTHTMDAADPGPGTEPDSHAPFKKIDVGSTDAVGAVSALGEILAMNDSEIAGFPGTEAFDASVEAIHAVLARGGADAGRAVVEAWETLIPATGTRPSWTSTHFEILYGATYPAADSNTWAPLCHPPLYRALSAPTFGDIIEFVAGGDFDTGVHAGMKFSLLGAAIVNAITCGGCNNGAFADQVAKVDALLEGVEYEDGYRWYTDPNKPVATDGRRALDLLAAYGEIVDEQRMQSVMDLLVEYGATHNAIDFPASDRARKMLAAAAARVPVCPCLQEGAGGAGGACDPEEPYGEGSFGRVCPAGPDSSDQVIKYFTGEDAMSAATAEHRIMNDIFGQCSANPGGVERGRPCVDGEVMEYKGAFMDFRAHRSGPEPRTVPYIVMSRAHGKDPSKYFDQRRTDVSAYREEVIAFGRAAARAIGDLHASGWAHSDIKPDNMFYDAGSGAGNDSSPAAAAAADGIVHLIDFGGALAKADWNRESFTTSRAYLDPGLDLETNFKPANVRDWDALYVTIARLLAAGGAAGLESRAEYGDDDVERARDLFEIPEPPPGSEYE